MFRRNPGAQQPRRSQNLAAHSKALRDSTPAPAPTSRDVPGPQRGRGHAPATRPQAPAHPGCPVCVPLVTGPSPAGVQPNTRAALNHFPTKCNSATSASFLPAFINQLNRPYPPTPAPVPWDRTTKAHRQLARPAPGVATRGRFTPKALASFSPPEKHSAMTSALRVRLLKRSHGSPLPSRSKGEPVTFKVQQSVQFCSNICFKMLIFWLEGFTGKNQK